MINFALLGPTCSGKTTCANRLVQLFPLRHLSTGQVLRENRVQQTALGILTRQYVEQGELVPDEIMNAMIEEAVRKTPPEQGLLCDGFPSTLYQARYLEELFRATNRRLDAVVLMEIPEPVVFARAAKRVPHRSDDRPEILRNRLHVFRRTTGPVIDFYRKSKRLCCLDATGSIPEVAEAAQRLIERIQSAQFEGTLTQAENQMVDHFLSGSMPAEVTGAPPSLDIVLIGAPGSGKGTQASFLAEQLNIPHIAVGELFRENLNQDSILGKIARTYIDRGELVPDDITEAMVRERLSRSDTSQGYILDGFPRTLPQAQALAEIMSDLQRKLDCVLYLAVPDELIVNRISGRRLCPVCHTPYHTEFNPPKADLVCDRDGSPLYQRDDDNPATVWARLKTFYGQTMPAIQHYRQAGLLAEVSGAGSVAQVKEAMLQTVQKVRRQ
jgi:adenylate kinase